MWIWLCENFDTIKCSRILLFCNSKRGTRELGQRRKTMSNKNQQPYCNIRLTIWLQFCDICYVFIFTNLNLCQSHYSNFILSRNSLAATCGYTKFWLGYNSYAMNNASYSSTDYQFQPWMPTITGVSSINSNDVQCIYYDATSNQTVLDSCSLNNSFICKQEFVAGSSFFNI